MPAPPRALPRSLTPNPRRRLLRAALALAATAATGCASAGHRSDWGRSTRARRLARHLAATRALPLDWVQQQLQRSHHVAAVTRLILPVPRGRRDWHAYRARVLEPARIRAGVAFVRAHAAALARAQDRDGVPPSIVSGLLGVETRWGADMGQFHVLDVLATLALDWPAAAPRDRSADFADELGAYLRWCRDTDQDPAAVRGSYAGAIGMPQFMPSALLRWASSFDAATPDLIHRPGDAIASVANFLRQHGWQRDLPAHFPVRVPTTVEPALLARLLAADITPSWSAADLTRAGLQLDPTAAAFSGKLALVELPNADAPSDYVLGTANFFALTRYNRSAFYALGVIELGDAVAQASAAQRDVDA